MKILHIAKHGPHDNQDEDAVAYALRKLGCSVTCLHEKRAGDHVRAHMRDVKAHDFVLFHKWEDVDAIRSLPIPAVFWYFDLVHSDDWELKNRNEVRTKWMRDVAPHCIAGFCTDGDWVQEYGPPLHWLMQGADERAVGPGRSVPELASDVLFTGSTIHGGKRIQHVEHLRKRWGAQFKCVGDNPRERVHGRRLADLLCSAKIVVAPDGPVTDRYWSNRVYLTLGFGGFLLHPRCAGLLQQYSDSELRTYADRDSLDALIEWYIWEPNDAAEFAAAGYRATVERHLYRHRCEELIRIVQGLM